MKVYNENKTQVLTDYDLNKGYLKGDTLIHHIPEVKAVKEQSHYEVIAEYPNGGKEIEKVIDVEAVEGVPAHDEVEEIQVYIPYTEDELVKYTQKRYERRVESLIGERYSLSQELALLRQRDVKVEEFAVYNAYAEECKATAKAEIGI